MNSSLKIFKGTGILTGSDIFSRVFDLARVLFITHFFSVADYGLYSIAVATSVFLASFIMPKFPEVLTKFSPKYQDNSMRSFKEFFSTTVFFYLVSGLVVGLFVFLFSEFISISYYEKLELVNLIKLSSILVLAYSLSSVLMHFCMSGEKFWTVSIGRFLFAISNLLFTIFLFFYSNYDAASLLLALISSYFIQIIVFVIALRGSFCFCLPKFQKQVMKFWTPLILASLFKNIKNNLPSVIIGRFLDAVSVGLYDIALRTATLVYFILDSYFSTVYVICINTYERAKKEFSMLINNSTAYGSFAIGLVGMLGIIFSDFIFGFLYGSQYADGIEAYKIIVIASGFAYAVTSFPRSIYFSFGKSKVYLLSTVISGLVSLVLLLVLTSQFGFIGAVYAFLFSNIFDFSIHTLFSKFLLKTFRPSLALAPVLLFVSIYYLLLERFDTYATGFAGLILYISLIYFSGLIDFKNLYKFIIGNVLKR